ncbi:MAG: hypothetical protein JSV04_04930 [Candidatus Heimdallarchaeota archaeon]|nr:MAG: hypothetical protein JSV04_04930 [Candidatus Heimdallarchaeota archaeon]
MKIKISQTTVWELQGEDWKNIFHQDSSFSRVWIGWCSSEECHGGWINLPLPFEVEFDAFSYSNRNLGMVRVMEILIEHSRQLTLIRQQFGEYLKIQQEPISGGTKPKIVSFVEDIIMKLPDFIQTQRELLISIREEMSWNEVVTKDWRKIQDEIDQLGKLFPDAVELPENLQGAYSSQQRLLEDLHREFHPESLLKDALYRTMQTYSDAYSKLLRQLKSRTHTPNGLTDILQQIQNLESDLNEFGDQINRNSSLQQSLKELFNYQRNILVEDLRIMRFLIHDEQKKKG